MSTNITNFKGRIENLLPLDENYTFLVGAGISMNPPSNLPSAREICRSLLEYFAPKIQIENILNLKSLRYELLVELIQIQYDNKLLFMNFFDNTLTQAPWPQP